MERNILKNNNFKRLIKSEFFDAQGKEEDENYVEIYQNPTSSKIEKIKQKDKYHCIRGIIELNSGIIYAWTGDVIHSFIRNSEIDTDNSLHFAFDSDGFAFDVWNLDYSLQNIYEILNKYKNKLSQIGNINSEILIGPTIDKFGNGELDWTDDREGSFVFQNWSEMDEYVKNINSTTKMSRLASSYISTLHSIILGSGDIISFDVRIVNNKPWYQIAHNHEFYNSNYYDGDDFERAYEMYEELLLAFKRISEAEKLRKSKNNFQEDIKKLFQIKKKDVDNYYTLKRAPSFLGVNGF